MSDEKRYLTASDLAFLGALDDFYDVYCTVKEIYENTRNEYTATHSGKNILWPEKWNQLCRKSVRSVCEPLLNQYLYIFTNDIFAFHANAYGFETFRMVYTRPSKNPMNVHIAIKTFSEFLVDIQCAVTRIIHRRINYSRALYPYIRVENEVTRHIINLVEKQKIQLKVSARIMSSDTNLILYLVDTLSSTSCYKNFHNVISTTFTADLLDQSGTIQLPVHYCCECNKYFIGTQTLQQFEKNYGHLIIDKRKYSEELFTNIRIESKLHQLGYNVRDGAMTSIERQRLLVYLLEHERISYFEMCSTIENNIRMHQNSIHHQLAVVKWKDDLKFIGNYILGKK